MGWLTTTLRRSLWLLLIVGAGGALWSWRRDAADASSPAPAEWPPITPTAPEPTSEATSAPTSAPTSWAEPLADGSCPEGYPVKANDNSGIFHLPGGRFYDRTKPERCYSDADAAAADGYRRAKT